MLYYVPALRSSCVPALFASPFNISLNYWLKFNELHSENRLTLYGDSV